MMPRENGITFSCPNTSSNSTSREEVINILQFQAFGLGEEEKDHRNLSPVSIIRNIEIGFRIGVSYPGKAEAGEYDKCFPSNVVNCGWRNLDDNNYEG